MRRSLHALFALVLLHAAPGRAQQVVPLAQYCARSGSREPRIRPHDDPLAWTGRPAYLAGQVVNYAGRPLPAVVRVFRNLTDSVPVRAISVDARGVFRLDSLAPDNYVLAVRGLGYQAQWHELQLPGAGSDTLCIRLRPRPIELAPVVPVRKPR